jgi:hypothetical protein
MPNDAAPSATNRTGVDAWFTPGRFAALFGLFLFITFFSVFTGRETFFYRDYGLFTYPIAQHYREAFWHGELPLWNHLNCTGIPLLAQWNTAMLYPPSLFYLVFPLPWSLGVFSVCHLWLAAMGMYFLARRWTGSQFAAAVAGLAFGFNGLSWYMVMWLSNLGAYAWMPWVVLAVESAWRAGGARRIVLASLAGAMQMLAGAPEIILLTWGVLGVLWLMDFFRSEIPRGRLMLRFALVPVIVAALSLAQLLPFMELLRHSDRSASYGDADWAMPLSGLANFLVPAFHCQTTSEGIFVQISQYWTPSHYAGAGILALALAGAIGARNRRAWLLAGAALFGILMALGPHGLLYSGLKAVFPQIGFMRYPIKFVTLTMFALPPLAAFAVSRQQEIAGSRRARLLLPGIALALLALIGLIVWSAWKHELPAGNWPATWHNALLRGAFLLLIAGVVIGLGRAKELKLQGLLSIALLLLLWIDVQTHMPNLSPTVDPSVYSPGMIRESLKLPAPAADEPRFMGTFAAIYKMQFTNLTNREANYLSRRLSLFDDCNLLDDIPKIDGFLSIYLREPKQITERLYAYDQANIDLKGLKDFLDIGYINVPDPTGEKAIEWTNRATFLPLVTTGQKPVFADATNTLAGLVRLDFDPRQIVYLPAEASNSITVNQTDAKIVSSKMSAQKVAAEVEAKSPALVVVAQSYYPPWHAYVDGKRAVVWRANHAFQAVEVPAGKHEVVLKYEDNTFRAGAIISLAALAGCGVVWLRGRKIPAA